MFAVPLGENTGRWSAEPASMMRDPLHEQPVRRGLTEPDRGIVSRVESEFYQLKFTGCRRV
ncbi:hypothetical protein [Streptomyces adelaidensis]|uniref:hypothetical protein n=1 Tax=Streptomyces adelaidensis TaxID=2796465 RepID=UPI001907DD87|nr:hypothetical protein [Streptomyces adelaidensis]